MLYGFSGVILQGALVTLELAISSVVLAVIIGLIGAGGKLSQNRLSGLIFEGYTTLIRGVPDLVLMLLIFYGLQIALNTVTDAMGVGQIDIDPMVAGIITLGFIYGAYFTETFRGAFYGCAERAYRGGDGVRFYSWASVSADYVSGDDALRPARHWQQLAGDSQIYRFGFVTRPGRCGQSHATGRQKYLGTVLFRHRLWRDLPGFHHRFQWCAAVP
ncbi:histidine transport system permease HisQ [Escherichia coli]|uniref:Histidine transport system permease HisQ n=1 Tax=Escherichia coli TaxID=562 RepID=A0A377D298_ECOLX|nr:histidine transport system permease HisQ [Escherichia coli]